MVEPFPTTEDWDNEEWSGSLSDTKMLNIPRIDNTAVFTPSVNTQSLSTDGDAQAQNSTTEPWDANELNGPTDGQITTYSYSNPAHIPAHPHHQTLVQQMNPGSRQSPVSAVTAPPPATDTQPPTADTFHHQHHHQPMGMSGSLTAAQSQYLSQLTQQSQRHDNSVYTSNYGVYGSSDITNQRKPQRARVPPPSKIPSSAVEMPGGAEGGGALFLDVQFGALEPDQLADTPKPPAPAAPEPAAPHEPAADPPAAYPPAKLNETLSAVETTPQSQPSTTSEPTVTNTTLAGTALEAQLAASMKQLSTAAPPQAPSTDVQAHTLAHHQQRPKTVGQQNVYAAHHAVSHHPPVYGANVYAPQVNSTNAASLTGASAMTATAYPSSVTLTQYQPMMNSYQTSSSAGAYGGSALYTAAPYAPYQPAPAAPPAPKGPPKDAPQYDNSVASSNSLTNTTTTQTSTAKVATTTVVAGHGGGGGGSAYAGGALYGAGATPYAPYDDQLMRSTLPHHMGGYYEVGYGGREGAFGLSAGERFGRTDAASPQQVPAAALPPGYAYFAYQPPPTTYQYGVYPTYGGGSSVGGVGGVGSVAGGGKVSSYAAGQQAPYDGDSYKAGAAYSAPGKGPAPADLSSAMYAKPHVALNKVNSYEKATFHSGTPPPFGGASHLYIPGPPHHHPHHHAPQQHQMDVRVNSSHNRRESVAGGGGGRAASSKPAASKPSYSQSYWAPN